MKNLTFDGTQEALRPITSLLSKSEKACQKLTPGTWQHKMLKKNIDALQVASHLINDDRTAPQNDLRDALSAISDMASRSEKALSKFEPGTSQHTLQRNRLNALQIAEVLVKQGIECDSA
ncbi:hypothetical protein [Bowmanella denitrificans]|uniref:hypothetical protein n=1 Tax=Bowmanella denitrificans TaxID=366582 RepID=UPI000C9AF264|nr:hypothetical protein [Bowmanella denitrificans]